MVTDIRELVIVESHNIDTTDVIIVLGGGVLDRMKSTIELYIHLNAHEFWITGGSTAEGMIFTTAGVSRMIAIENGISEEKIHILNTNSTWEDGLVITQRLEEHDVKNAVIVTSWYHACRASRVLRKLDQNNETVLTVFPTYRGYREYNSWRNDRQSIKLVAVEYLKNIYYTIKYGITP